MRPLVEEVQMKGGITLFRGPGTTARRYLESDRATADDYYLEAGTALAGFTATDATGNVVDARTLDADAYAAWVDWTDPVTGTSMGTPREPGGGRKGSPRFAEMVINAPKSLSIAAALHPEVSAALDAAQQDAAAQIRQWLAQNSVTRVGPRRAQEVIPVEQLRTVAVTHRTSRAGDPHRHIHFQIGTRVRAAGRWRALDTAALFRQQGAIRAMGTAVIAAHPHLADTLHAHGLTLHPVSGEVVELEPFNQVMSKRSRQVERNLTRLEAEWEQAHPGEERGPVVQARLLHKAWAYERPSKKPSVLATEEAWREELTAAGYRPDRVTQAAQPAVADVDDLFVQEVASRALDRCAAAASTWTVHTIREHATRITTEHGVRGTPEVLRAFTDVAVQFAVQDCFTVLPEQVARPDHVLHLTSLRVIEADTTLRDLLTAATPDQKTQHPSVAHLPAAQELDADQLRAAAAIASTDPLVIVEGAAGSGKTSMLRPAITATRHAGRRMRVVAPAKKAAHVAGNTLSIPADSVAALVYAHGYRWNVDGVWTRLTAGDTDPDTDTPYTGPPDTARLVAGERVVVDEAGMLDQDTAIALLTVTGEAGATVALVGDRAQLSAVGRGGVLDIAAQIRGTTIDMTGLHRFRDAAYADLTVQLRDRTDPAAVFDRLQVMGLVILHDDEDALHSHIATTTVLGDAITVAGNEDARALNDRIQQQRLDHGQVDHTVTVAGSDGLDIGVEDVIQARKNDTGIGVANRQTFTVQHVTHDGDVYAIEYGDDRKKHVTVRLPADYVTEHTHLAYASTAHGVQGVTVTASHTVLDETLSAAGLYVGLTRGTHRNILHLIAENHDEARAQFVAAITRDGADRGLDAATQTAREEVRRLVTDGPVAFVNTERRRLAAAIAHAEKHANAWENAVTTLAGLRARHNAERENLDTTATAAEQHTANVHAETVTPLVEEAVADAARYQAAIDEVRDARTADRSAGWVRRRATARALETAQQHQHGLEDDTRARWGSVPPEHPEQARRWAQTVAAERAASVPEVSDAQHAATEARTAANRSARRHLDQRLRAYERLYAQIENPQTQPHGSAEGHRDRWATRADTLRATLAEIDALPPAQAAKTIRARQEALQREAERRRVRAAQLGTPTPASPGRNETERGIHW